MGRAQEIDGFAVVNWIASDHGLRCVYSAHLFCLSSNKSGAYFSPLGAIPDLLSLGETLQYEGVLTAKKKNRAVHDAIRLVGKKLLEVRNCT